MRRPAPMTSQADQCPKSREGGLSPFGFLAFGSGEVIKVDFWLSWLATWMWTSLIFWPLCFHRPSSPGLSRGPSVVGELPAGAFSVCPSAGEVVGLELYIYLCAPQSQSQSQNVYVV